MFFQLSARAVYGVELSETGAVIELRLTYSSMDGSVCGREHEGSCQVVFGRSAVFFNGNEVHAWGFDLALLESGMVTRLSLPERW